jgi:hypothetical protein
MGVVSSSQTTLAWALTDATGAHLVGGNLRWPTDNLGGPVEHALNLLRIAEAGFVPGCPSDRPPDAIDLGDAKPAVSPLDANPAELSRAERDLMTDLRQAAHADCRIPR